MPNVSDNHEAHNYAERIRERLPRRLQETREAARLSMYGLEKKSGVSREMISCIESGEAMATLFLMARLSFGVGKTLTEFIGVMEDGE